MKKDIIHKKCGKRIEDCTCNDARVVIKEQTLLQKAKSIKVKKGNHRKVYTLEDLELVEAWLNDNIGATQMAATLGYKISSGNYLYYCASVLKHYYQNGLVTIAKKK